MQNPEFYKQLTLSKDKQIDPIESLDFNKIGNYSIDSLLSQSAKSHVYLAHDKSHKPFVIKILSHKLTQEKAHRDQFLQEARILNMTSHENIVQIISQGICDQRPFLVMEFIQGISLRQFIVHYTLSIHDAIEIILQLAYALSHIHSLGILHLDLKPENIIVTENAKIKLLDFGISQFVADKNTKNLIGSPDYMSPEMRAQKGSYDNTSDMYSLGVIAFELFSSKLCFGKINLSQTQDFLAPFLKKCLALEKKERFNDIIDCIANLTSIVKNHPMANNLSSNQNIESITQTLFDDLIQNESLEIGLTHDHPCQNLFYSSHNITEQSQLFLIYNFEKTHLDNLCKSSILKSATKLLIKQSQENFELAPFLEELNKLVFQEKQKNTIHFQALYLDLFQNSLYLTGSGLATLFQFCNRKKSVDSLHTEGLKLGESEFLNCTVLSSGFFEGDQILLHNFMVYFPKIQEQVKLFSINIFNDLHLRAAKSLSKEEFFALKKECNASCSGSPLFTLQINRIE